jgi:hypothetical protein
VLETNFSVLLYLFIYFKFKNSTSWERTTIYIIGRKIDIHLVRQYWLTFGPILFCSAIELF